MRTLTPALLLVLAACASAPRTSLSPVEPVRFVEAELLVRPAAHGLERPDFVPIEVSEGAQARSVSVRARFLALDAALSDALLGEETPSLIAMVLTREHSERLIEDLRRERPGLDFANETQLVLPEQQEGHVTVCAQRAFVSGYTIRSSGRSALADPEVGVATQGSQLIATGRLDESGEHVELDLRLDVCELAESFDELEVALAGGSMRIQQPRGLLRSLSTSVRLGRDEVLWIGGAQSPSRPGANGLFALVEAGAQSAPAPTVQAP
jgi:hypothetical protein